MATSDALTNERSYDGDDEDSGYSGGSSASYDEDDDEDGGWAINKDHSDSLWDSAEDSSDDDEEAPELAAVEGADDDESDVAFVLDRLRKANAPRPCVALGFGPGLVAEAALFR